MPAVDFNPRPPRGGRRLLVISKFGTWLFQSTPSARRATPITKPCSSKDFVFQSTPSARRATTSETSALSLLKYFNPRPPRGGRLIALHKHGFPVVFQSTPSARRATQSLLLCVRAKKTFQSTPSARRATGFEVACGLVGFISIHALREEGDYYNAMDDLSQTQFQSTPSARRATYCLPVFFG